MVSWVWCALLASTRLAVPDGKDGADCITSRIEEVDFKRDGSWFMLGAFIQMIGVLDAFLLSPAGEGPSKLVVSTVAVGLISLITGELGRRHSRVSLLKVYMVASCIALYISVLGVAKSTLTLEVIKNPSKIWGTTKFELVEIIRTLVGLTIQVLAIGTTRLLIHNMSPPKRTLTLWSGEGGRRQICIAPPDESDDNPTTSHAYPALLSVSTPVWRVVNDESVEYPATRIVSLAVALRTRNKRGMEGKDNLGDFKIGSLPTLIYVPEFITDSGVVHEKGLISQELPPWLTKTTQKVYEDSGIFPLPINHVLVNEYLPNQGIMPHQDGPAYFPVVAIISLGSPAVMDFTPHSSLRFLPSTCTNNDKEESCDKVAPAVERDEWLDNHHPFSVLLMPRSLLIFKDTAYSDYLHGIKDTELQCFDGVLNEVEALNEQVRDCTVSRDIKSIHRTTNRISLTCRTVMKVHKNLFKI
ncbi:hypothetical protein FNV43_RR14872 [Rhamnella rubrinervis]|uniref:Fe2OG dioxygenase domain-containing protein n=1 Tax=Rhamnella rubrinervis TaxID=2594499 RepID=A0A8K0MGU7_9ROSA|nr:hypothetical protein FNV43_RR14872 [Rhamnella rubrinervis]